MARGWHRKPDTSDDDVIPFQGQLRTVKEAFRMLNEATEKQQDFLAILFMDCGFTRAQRNDFIENRVFRKITALDEITKAEASKLITELLELKESKR